jgi:intracellular sulfur oxidation DsrE/DsrF family protein
MNNKNDSIQDMLNAHADGQLDSAKREEVLSLLEADSELRGEMCDIYRIKDLVQTAYPLDEFEHKPYSQTLLNYRNFARVASILLAFIVTLGAGYALRDSGVLDKYNAITLTNTKVQNEKVILFISSSAPGKFKKALNKAETLAREFQNTGGKVYVVASAGGIDFLSSKDSNSPNKNKINELTERYPQLDFVACNNTLYQRKQEGHPVDLIDTAKIAPSAVEFVVKHLQQGWKYIAI